MCYKTPIQFALVCEYKELEFLSWDIFCWACSQWRELELVIREFLPFLIRDANSSDWLQAQQKIPNLGIPALCVHTLMQTEWKFY